MAVFFKKPLVKASAVDADADGDLLFPARIHDRADALLSADVAGVDADLGGAALRCGDGKAVVKVDIRHQRQRRCRRDLGKALGRVHIRNGQTRDLAACRRQRTELTQRALDVGRPGVQHRLNGNGRAAADGDAAHMDLFCHDSAPMS